MSADTLSAIRDYVDHALSDLEEALEEVKADPVASSLAGELESAAAFVRSISNDIERLYRKLQVR